MKKKIIIPIAIILVLAFGIFGFSQVSKSTGGTKTEQGRSVTYALALEQPSISSFSTSGVAALKDTEKQNASVTGKVQDLLVDVGDIVSVGDVLFTYSEDTLETLNDSLVDAQFGVESARLGLETARSSYANIKSNVEVTEQDLLPLESQVRSAEQTLEEYERQLTSLEKDLTTGQSNIDKAKAEFEKQKILYDNGIITLVELESFEDAITAQEKAYDSIVKQQKDLGYAIENANYSLDIANKNLDYAKNPDELDIEAQKEQAANSVSQSELSLQQAELTLARIQEEIDNFVLEEKSSFDGAITAIYATEGGAVQEDMVVMDITDVSKNNLIVNINVDQKNISDVALGQEVKVTSTGLGDDEVIGEVSKINATSTISGTTTTVSTTKVEVSFKEDIKGLKAGFLVECEVVTAVKENAVFIPIASLLTDETGMNYVYIVGDDNTALKRDVTLGAIDGLNAEVNEVLADEKIVTSGMKLISEGDILSPTEEY
ncbi:MAG: efflux RND transporter periplasmic adaptor subunit [Lachnospirales bacterium]